jgi:exodeoxyribonuclease V beta subunit
MPTAFDIVETSIEPGLSVIEASAGTGKTYAISRLVPRLLLERTVTRLREILLVTFTNDAASELSDRVRGVLEKLNATPEPDEAQSDPGAHALRQKFRTREDREIIARALLDIDQLGVSTIHAFCLRTLQTEGTLCGLPVIPEIVPDAEAIIDEALYELWKTKVAGNGFLSAIAAAQEWNPGADLWLVKQVIGVDDPEMLPPPRPLDEILNELKAGAGRFTGKMVEELNAFAAKVTGWNNAGGDEEFRDKQFANLRESANFLAWIKAVTWLPQIASGKGGLIAARGAANKALIAEAAQLPAVLLAREMSALYVQLSWHWRLDCARTVRQTVAAALRKNRQITYDGQISTLRDALRSEKTGPQLRERLREQYKVALIDESQDTDPRQFEIFRGIFSGPGSGASRMVLIGDPKQAIYEFRGADVNTYLDARARAGDNVHSLSKTFRSPQPLVNAVNAVFKREGSLLKDGLDFEPATSGLDADIFLEADGVDPDVRLEAWVVPDEQAANYSNAGSRLELIAGCVASEIVRLLRGGARIVRGGEGRQVKPGDFAVLVSDRFEAAAMIAAFQARRVPAIQAKAADILTTDEAGELLVVLRAVEEPRRSDLRMAALSTRLMGRTDADIRRILDDAEEDDAMLEKFLRWQSTLHRRGIAAALAEIDDDEKMTLRLAGIRHGERRVTNLRQLGDLLQEASHNVGNRPGHLLRWFAQEIAGIESGGGTEERQQQLESDAQAVKIVTMHSAKGLEYNLVFCPFLWTSRSIKKTGSVKVLARSGQPPLLVNLDLVEDRAPFDRAIQRVALEDRLRLAYVAITRARVKAWIFCGALAGKNPQPSALDWLLRTDEQPDFDAWFESTGTKPRGLLHETGLDLLVAEGNGAIRQQAPPVISDDEWLPSDSSSAARLAALDAPEIPEPWVLTSFSSLTREKNPHGAGETVAESAAAVPANPFFSAPGGAMVGTAIHDWIEGWDFSVPDAQAVRDHLRNYALPAPKGEQRTPFHECVAGMLAELRDAVLPGLDGTVADACPRAESSEWHFQLPINDSLSARSLAAVFAGHGEDEYAAMLEALPAEELKGYLHGFLDRLAFHSGVWGVIDWKTNRLESGYGEDSLRNCAMQSHYLLQTHLYLVALRRFLGPKVPIAGAWLVFLRGVHSGSSDGILHIQPSEALMAGLDGLFFKPSSRS